MAQARDLSSMHAPMFDLRACLKFFGQVSKKEIVREVARSDKPYLRNLQIAKHKSLRSERLPDLCFAICRFSQVRPHKVSSLLLVPCPHRIWGKLKKKKKKKKESVCMVIDLTATAMMEEGVKIVSFKVNADGRQYVPASYALLVERSKTFANAFEELSSARGR